MITEPYPILYILMRTDLDSMNCGKSIAQGSHASNAFYHGQLKSMMYHALDPGKAIQRFFDGDDGHNQEYDLFVRWTRATDQGFGTVLTVAIDEYGMNKVIESAQRSELVCGITHDPTYPLVDGNTVHSIPLDTCAYVLIESDDPLRKMILTQPLHP